jgi:hypothetical protein
MADGERWEGEGQDGMRVSIEKALMHPSTNRQRCAGWSLNSKHKFVQCPKAFTPTRSTQIYHSHDCYLQTWRWRGEHHVLGEIYVRGRHIKPHAPQACKGWTKTDGVIVECGIIFTPRNAHQEYHSPACLYQTRRWRLQGLHLGDSQRRICSYRNCKKGSGGTRNTFIRPHRRGSRFFCDGRCNAAEKRCLEAERVAKLEANQRDQHSNTKRGPKEKPEESKRYFIIGKLVEQKLASGLELTAARRRVAKDAGITYRSAAVYHKTFRKLTRNKIAA